MVSSGVGLVGLVTHLYIVGYLRDFVKREKARSVVRPVSRFDLATAVAAVQLWVFPVDVDCHEAPAIGAGGRADTLSLSLGTLVAASAPIVKYAEQRVSTRPCVRMRAQLIGES